VSPQAGRGSGVAMRTADLVVVGSGPAGLSAAIEAGKRGVETILIEENRSPGGQLHKQIHKFFGSKEHLAGARGFEIAETLATEARKWTTDILLDTAVHGRFEDGSLGIVIDSADGDLVKPRAVVLACGALERAITFTGWTLPGVMGTGAVQTMINVHRVRPGRRFLIVGSGNVGLIVAYQLLQAQAEVIAIVERLPKIGGWQVHADKVRRLGIPVLTSSTVVKAIGEEEVQGVVIATVNEAGEPIAGSERTLDVDTVCIAAGLKPRAELPLLFGCATVEIPCLGGRIPLRDENMETTVPLVFVAGDVAGIGEASIAMDQGRLAGIAAAEGLGLGKESELQKERSTIRARLRAFNDGPVGKSRAAAENRILDELVKARATARRPRDGQQDV